LSRAETHLPRIGVIVFTSGDFRALHRTVHGQRKGWNRWLSVGTAGMRSVVVARSPIGAPAAIVTMEVMAALGCRSFLTFCAVEMEAAALWAVARHRGVRAASLFVVSDELGGRERNPGFEDPRFLTGKRRARRLLIDVISRGEA